MTTLETPKAPKQFYAYVHARPDGTPFYVGKGFGKRAHNFSDRKAWHQNVVAKHGKENILVGVCPVSSEEFAFELEKGLIKTLRRMGHSLVNLTDGGEGTSGRVVSDETRAKHREFRHTSETKELMRQKRLAWNITDEMRQNMSRANKGRVPTPEAIAKGLLARQGFKHSDATKQKIGLANKGRRPSDECLEKSRLLAIARHRPHTLEERKLMSDIAKQRAPTAEQLARLTLENQKRIKPVMCTTTGEVFQSSSVAAKLFGVHKNAVNQAARGIGRVKGLEFRYVV